MVYFHVVTKRPHNNREKKEEEERRKQSKGRKREDYFVVELSGEVSEYTPRVSSLDYISMLGSVHNQ